MARRAGVPLLPMIKGDAYGLGVEAAVRALDRLEPWGYGIATVADLWEFYNRLPNGDRQFIILPGTAHSVVLATNRQLFWHVTRAFLTMPTPIAT